MGPTETGVRETLPRAAVDTPFRFLALPLLVALGGGVKLTRYPRRCQTVGLNLLATIESETSLGTGARSGLVSMQSVECYHLWDG